MKTATCEHTFVGTSEKGKWKVRSFGTNNRGRIAIEEVTTTIFRCSKCGTKKEFPDTWEWNYLAPGKAVGRSIQKQRSPHIGRPKRSRAASARSN